MPLEQEALQLDGRDYAQIRRALLSRIPRYTPEWTDFNESDPGITLIELFAWLSEQLLYEMNRVPERSYLKFLKLLGQELRPAVPATAYLSLEPTPAAQTTPDPPSVPDGAAFGASAPGGDLVIFEAREGIGVIRAPLTDVQVFDGASFSVVTEANAKPGTTFRPFGWQPQVGSALYLGFTQDQPQARQPFPAGMTWRVFFPVESPERRVVRSDKVSAEPVPPVELAWEYRPSDAPNTWRRLRVLDDRSAALTREGTIKVAGPAGRDAAAAASVEGRVPERRVWLRVRIAARSYPAGRAPVIDFIRPNVVEVQSLATVREEVLGQSTGLADQRLALQRRPVQPESLLLDTEQSPGGEITHWQRRDDLLASGRDDAHFVLNATAGEVQFGDGLNGLIPAAGSTVIARRYRYGGGLAANVEPDTITLPLSPLGGVASVTNIRRAEGGNDEERIGDFQKTAPTRLRHRNRAVSAADYAALAAEVGGVGRAIALPRFHPDYPGADVPGAVTVVVVPETDDPAPRPSQALLDAICRYLEPRRVLATELYLAEPEYVKITVEARIAVEPYASFDEVRVNVVQAINAELDPLGRGKAAKRAEPGAPASGSQEDAGAPSDAPGDGRDFGLDLYPTSLFSVIQRVTHVKAVHSLAVNGQVGEALNKPIMVPPNGLLYGAPDHAITVVPYDERGIR